MRAILAAGREGGPLVTKLDTAGFVHSMERKRMNNILSDHLIACAGGSVYICIGLFLLFIVLLYFSMFHSHYLFLPVSIFRSVKPITTKQKEAMSLSVVVQWPKMRKYLLDPSDRPWVVFLEHGQTILFFLD